MTQQEALDRLNSPEWHALDRRLTYLSLRKVGPPPWNLTDHVCLPPLTEEEEKELVALKAEWFELNRLAFPFSRVPLPQGVRGGYPPHTPSGAEGV